jgi:hypothetical protein
MSQIFISIIMMLWLLQVDAESATREGRKLEEFSLDDWTGLIRYIVALGFVAIGLFFSLYSHISIWFYLKNYQKAFLIPGDVLSCQERQGNSQKPYEIEVLYTAEQNPHKDDPRKRFRYPETKVAKSYLRRFDTDNITPRGSQIQLLLLQGLARSACTPEMIDTKRRDYSHLRTVLYLIPGLFLLGLIFYLCSQEIMEMEDEKDQRIGWGVLAISTGLVLFVANVICDGRFQKEKERIFLSAVVIKRKQGNAPPASTYNQGMTPVQAKSEPLLHQQHPNSPHVPVVYGQELSIVTGKDVPCSH